MTAFAAALDVLFANPHLARDVVYAPDGGAARRVRAILRRPDEITDFGSARIMSDSTWMDIRISEIADPRPGDRITIDAEKLVIEGEPKRDRERLVWTLELHPK